MRTQHLLTVGATLLLSTALNAAIIHSDDFSSNSLTDYNNPTGGRQSFIYNATNDNLTVRTTGTNAAALATPIGSFNSLGGSISVSVDFLTSTHVNSGSFNAAAVGLSTGATTFYGTFSGFEVTARQDGTAGSYFLRLRMGDNSTGQLTNSQVALAASTWHRLVLNVDSTATAQEYNVSAYVTTQADPNTNLLSLGETLVTRVAANGFINNTDSLYAGLAGTTNGTVNGGAIALDNFTVTAIPEPGTLALVGVFMASLLLFRRKRA